MKNLIEQSYYGTIGYISCEQDINMLKSYIAWNKPILDKFKNIIVATNYIESNNKKHFQDLNKELWVENFPNVIILDSNTNRGHSFGTADLDNMLINWCKNNNIKWLCKASNDTILHSELLDKKIKDADFHYLNGIGYGGMEKYGFVFDRIEHEDFYPQTNFYFIRTDKIDYLNSREYLDATYHHIKSLKDYNGKVWEYIVGWSCEDFLKQCVERNKLTTNHLIPTKEYKILLKHIQSNLIHDCSHKNIKIEGVTHFHNHRLPITII